MSKEIDRARLKAIESAQYECRQHHFALIELLLRIPGIMQAEAIKLLNEAHGQAQIALAHSKAVVFRRLK